MTPANEPHPDALRLAAACKVGRILAGHDAGVARWPWPELPNRDEVTLEEIKLQAVRRAIEKHGGNIMRAARELNIERNTLYQIVNRNGLKRMPKPPENIVRLAQVAAVVVMMLVAVGCAGKRTNIQQPTANIEQPMLPPLPPAGRSSQIEGRESQATAAAVAPPLPPVKHLQWRNAPGATVTIIERCDLTGPWAQMGRVTNVQTFAVTLTGVAGMFRIGHPTNEPRHWWDGERGMYRQE